MEKFKKHLPNVLTVIRILGAILAIYLGIESKYICLIILGIVLAILDYLDGFFARKFKAASDMGAKLDVLADKLFSLGLLIVLIYKNNNFFYLLGIEIIIFIISAYCYLKKGIQVTLLISKFKTWLIFISIILGFFSLIYPFLNNLVNGLVYLTLTLQILNLFAYIWYSFKKDHKKELFNDYVLYYNIIAEIVSNEEFQKRKDYQHHIDESVYEHVLRVSYDCFKIGKKLHLDYESLAIAGLLHDFYEHPWQYNKEKKPLFKKHAFTHAREAVLNAKRVFGTNIVNKKIESIMITHMFPLNKKLPTSKEGWLLTLIDKADSIDFIMHPVALFKIFCQKEYDQKEKMTIKKIKRHVLHHKNVK